MLISMNWIEDFVDLKGLDKEELIRRFTLSTAEVEEIIYKGKNLKDVVVGKILSVENHPTSKKLHILKVDGGDKVYDVICGAPNVREGLVVPFAKEGGQVGDLKINCATIAGFESHGMCCSEAELSISDNHAGLMELDENLVIGTNILDVFDIEDVVFEVDNKSLTNRPDLWGHYGIAREFAALTGRELKAVPKEDLSKYNDLSPVEIKITDTDNCFRYSGLTLENVTKKLSPVNMRIRLFYCGTRGINLLADLTNYLMLELGQPMHAFDNRKVTKIDVKRFDSAFKFKTLDDIEREIDENTLMICNEDGPVAIAGIMGGLNSEIVDDTSSLLLESANFDAICVRKSSTRMGLRTDASMRYEKTLDPEITLLAIERFVKLLSEIDCDIKITSSLTDVYAKTYPEIKLDFTKAYVDRYTGIEIENAKILSTLNSLGFNAKESGDVFSVTVPSWRATKDVTIKADIIEEITRIYGYDNFEIKTSKSPLYPVLASSTRLCDNFTKDILVNSYKLHELHSYLWCDSKKYKDLGIELVDNVHLVNAINPDCTVIRQSMIPTLLSFVNENKNFGSDFGIFEIGRVVEGISKNGDCNERKKLGIVLYSKTLGEKDLYFKLRDIIYSLITKIKHITPKFEICEATQTFAHPKNTAKISVDGINLGAMNTLHPAVSKNIDKKAAIVSAEIDMHSLAEINTKTLSYDEPSKFPGIEIDLSLTLNNSTTYDELTFAWADVTELLKKVSFIDSYETDGQKSVTLRFLFSSKEKTLSKAELQVNIDKILENLLSKGIKLRT